MQSRVPLGSGKFHVVVLVTIIFVNIIVNLQSTPEDNDQVKRARCVFQF